MLLTVVGHGEPEDRDDETLAHSSQNCKDIRGDRDRAGVVYTF